MFLIGFLMTGFTSLRNLMIIVLCGIGLAGAVCGCSGKGVGRGIVAGRGIARFRLHAPIGLYMAFSQREFPEANS